MANGPNIFQMLLVFITSDNQFGFKKESSCSHALYTLKCTVDYYVSCIVLR